MTFLPRAVGRANLITGSVSRSAITRPQRDRGSDRSGATGVPDAKDQAALTRKVRCFRVDVRDAAARRARDTERAAPCALSTFVSRRASLVGWSRKDCALTSTLVFVPSYACFVCR